MLGDQFADLVALARGGDADAFACLWRDAQPMLLRYLRVSAGGTADDVASRAWLKVIEGLSGFDGDEPGFRRWLVTIARNLVIDDARRAGRRRERVAAYPAQEAGAREPMAVDVADVVAERMSTDMAIRLVASLPRDQAEMIMLRVVAGFDVADVAKVVGRSPGAVRVAVHRGLRRLREVLEAEGRGIPVASAVTGAVTGAVPGPFAEPVTGWGTAAFPDRDA